VHLVRVVSDQKTIAGPLPVTLTWPVPFRTPVIATTSPHMHWIDIPTTIEYSILRVSFVPGTGNLYKPVTGLAHMTTKRGVSQLLYNVRLVTAVCKTIDRSKRCLFER
jgi:hypothetical protein